MTLLQLKVDWNEHSPRECEKKGREASGGDKYRGKVSCRLKMKLTKSEQNACRAGVLAVLGV